MLYCIQTTMNTNSIKQISISLLASAMCMTVVLSHLHAKDAVSLMSQQQAALKQVAGFDITAKAMGDLHHHIDKAGLKNITADNGSTTAARSRELNPLENDVLDMTLGSWLHDFLLRFRVVSSLCVQY